MEPMLTQDDVATILDVSPRTLERWRMQKRGPAYAVIEGQVRYKRDDVIAYIDERMVTHP